MGQSFWLHAEDNCELYVQHWGREMRNPKAVIQVAHGMVEHIGRYDAFANYLNEQGFIVYGNDHRGHGHTGDKQGLLGFFSDDNGFELIVEDMYYLTRHIQKRHPSLPIFIFGHSMGSFITRNFLQKYSHEVSGVILSGTGYFSKVSSLAGKAVASFLPPQKQSKLMNALAFDSYNNKIKNKRTNFDWLTRDERVVDDYINDPLAGYVPTARFFVDLLSGILTMQDQTRNRTIRKDLPMLFISGEADPVGDFGKGVFRTANNYTQLGMENIAVLLFPEARHELLNELNNEEVYKTIHQWLREQLD